MTREEVIERIKKLLRMKRGGTAAEVETALAMAAALAREHGINLNSIDPEEKLKSEQIRDERIHVGSRIQCERKYATLICQVFFNVECFSRVESRTWYSWKRITEVQEFVFVGTDVDLTIAIYVYHFLVGHFRREWTTRRGRCRNREAFLWGMYVGLNAKLHEQQPAEDAQSGPGLVRMSRGLARRNYIAQHFGELKSFSVEPDHDADEAMRKGYHAGRETEIRKGIDGKAVNPLQLT